MAWFILLASLIFLASSWRAHGPPLASFGIVALAYFLIWNHMLVSMDGSLITTLQDAGAAIWLNIKRGLASAVLWIDQTRSAWALSLTALSLALGTVVFYILRSKAGGPKFHANGTDRPGVAGNMVVVFAKLLIGVCTAGLIMTIIQQTGLANDLAQILVALVGESRAALILLVAMASIGLGLLMPALPAYLIAAALFGLALRTVGIDWLTAHLGLLAIVGTSPLIKWLVRRRSSPVAVQQSF